MRKHDVLSFKMKSFYKTRDRNLERILLGKDPSHGAHDDVHRVVEQLRAAFPAEAIPANVEAAHVAAMLEQAQVAHCAGAPVAGEEVAVAVAAAPAPRRRTGRTQRRLSPLIASRSLRIVTVAILGLAIFGGAATAGALPDPLQSAVSRAASVVGIPIPASHGAPPVPSAPDTGGVPSATSLAPSPPVGGVGVGGSGRAGAAVATTSPVTAPPPVTVPATVPAEVPPTVRPETPAVTVPVTIPATTLPSVPVTGPSTIPGVPPTIEVGPPPPGPPPGQ